MKNKHMMETGGVIGQEIVFDDNGEENTGVIKDIHEITGNYIVATDDGRTVLADKELDVIRLGKMRESAKPRMRFGLFENGGNLDSMTLNQLLDKVPVFERMNIDGYSNYARNKEAFDDLVKEFGNKRYSEEQSRQYDNFKKRKVMYENSYKQNVIKYLQSRKMENGGNIKKSDIEYTLRLAIEDNGYNPISLKSVKKIGKKYQIIVSSYISEEFAHQIIADINHTLKTTFGIINGSYQKTLSGNKSFEILQIKMEDGGNIAKENNEMLHSQAKEAKHHIEELHNVLTSKTKVEPWVVAKMTRAKTDLSDITHYLDGNTSKMAKGGKLTDAQQEKFNKVMHEWKQGTLHSGSANGPIVKDQDQAIAIAYSEAYGMDKMLFGGMVNDLSDDEIDRMEGLVPISTLHELLDNAKFIIADMYEEGFEKDEIMSFLAYKISQIGNVNMAQGGGVEEINVKSLEGYWESYNKGVMSGKKDEGYVSIKNEEDLKDYITQKIGNVVKEIKLLEKGKSYPYNRSNPYYEDTYLVTLKNGSTFEVERSYGRPSWSGNVDYKEQISIKNIKNKMAQGGGVTSKEEKMIASKAKAIFRDLKKDGYDNFDLAMMTKEEARETVDEFSDVPDNLKSQVADHLYMICQNLNFEHGGSMYTKGGNIKKGDVYEWHTVDYDSKKGNNYKVVKQVEITDIRNGDVIGRVVGTSNEFIIREPNKYLKKKVSSKMANGGGVASKEEKMIASKAKAIFRDLKRDGYDKFDLATITKEEAIETVDNFSDVPDDLKKDVANYLFMLCQRISFEKGGSMYNKGGGITEVSKVYLLTGIYGAKGIPGKVLFAFKKEIEKHNFEGGVNSMLSDINNLWSKWSINEGIEIIKNEVFKKVDKKYILYITSTLDKVKWEPDTVNKINKEGSDNLYIRIPSDFVINIGFYDDVDSNKFAKKLGGMNNTALVYNQTEVFGNYQNVGYNNIEIRESLFILIKSENKKMSTGGKMTGWKHKSK